MTTLTTNTVSKRKQRPYKRITESESEIVPRLYNELRKPSLVVENILSVGYGEMTTFYRSLPNKTSHARRINTTLQAAGKIVKDLLKFMPQSIDQVADEFSNETLDEQTQQQQTLTQSSSTFQPTQSQHLSDKD
ncbi:unnamed protein product [Didymodactylos carnosus]|uniref:Uncharacterized protein n=1 Tax=Didymodactylos carnosus TaxID=1234261 RepID=A0A8S2X5X9_9BILA|nr:unnamed protein product [Didymodactylos carnosus]